VKISTDTDSLEVRPRPPTIDFSKNSLFLETPTTSHNTEQLVELLRKQSKHLEAVEHKLNEIVSYIVTRYIYIGCEFFFHLPVRNKREKTTRTRTRETVPEGNKHTLKRKNILKKSLLE
jgi:hypothetical protein